MRRCRRYHKKKMWNGGVISPSSSRSYVYFRIRTHLDIVGVIPQPARRQLRHVPRLQPLVNVDLGDEGATVGLIPLHGPVPARACAARPRQVHLLGVNITEQQAFILRDSQVHRQRQNEGDVDTCSEHRTYVGTFESTRRYDSY